MWARAGSRSATRLSARRKASRIPKIPSRITKSITSAPFTQQPWVSWCSRAGAIPSRTTSFTICTTRPFRWAGPGATDRNHSKGNTIEFNQLHHIGKDTLSDMGAISTLGVQPGTVIRNNLIHDVEAFTYGGWRI